MMPNFDVVIGIWPDTDAPAGVLMLACKGLGRVDGSDEGRPPNYVHPVPGSGGELALQARYGSAYWPREAAIQRPHGEPGLGRVLIKWNLSDQTNVRFGPLCGLK